VLREKIKTGDLLTLDCVSGSLECHVSDIEQRTLPGAMNGYQKGLGREFFKVFRQNVTDSEEGASTLF
jgi:dihydroxyacid dehydratase/phosphogluconate dehydratase